MSETSNVKRMTATRSSAVCEDVAMMETFCSLMVRVISDSRPWRSRASICTVTVKTAPEESPRVVLMAKQGGADYEWYLNNGMIDRFILSSEFEKEFPTL